MSTSGGLYQTHFTVVIAIVTVRTDEKCSVSTSGGLYQTHFTVVIAIVTVLLTWLVCFHVDPFIRS